MDFFPKPDKQHKQNYYQCSICGQDNHTLVLEPVTKQITCCECMSTPVENTLAGKRKILTRQPKRIDSGQAFLDSMRNFKACCSAYLK